MVITSQLVCGPHLRVTEAVSVSDVTSDQAPESWRVETLMCRDQEVTRRTGRGGAKDFPEQRRSLYNVTVLTGLD